MPKYSEQVTWLKQILLHGTGEQQWDTSGVWVCETHPLVPFDNSGIDFQCLCGGAGMPPIRGFLRLLVATAVH